MISAIFSLLGLLLLLASIAALIKPSWVKAPKNSRILGFLAYFTAAILMGSGASAFMTPEQKAEQEARTAAYQAKQAAEAAEKQKAYEASELKKTKDELEKVKAEAEKAKQDAELAKQEAEKAKQESEKKVTQNAVKASEPTKTANSEEATKTTSTSTAQAAERVCAKGDQECFAKKFIRVAELLCVPEVEKMARFDIRWNDGMFDMKFDSWRPSKKKGLVTVGGDKLQMQNGFGAWQKVIYECDFDIESGLPVAVRVNPK